MNMEISDQSFNVVDIKPENMEELTEVITGQIPPNKLQYVRTFNSRGCINWLTCDNQHCVTRTQKL